MIFRIFAFFAHIHEQELIATIHSLLYFVHIGLAHAGFSVVNNLQESGRMLVGHSRFLSKFSEEHPTNRRSFLLGELSGTMLRFSATIKTVKTEQRRIGL